MTWLQQVFILILLCLIFKEVSGDWDFQSYHSCWNIVFQEGGRRAKTGSGADSMSIPRPYKSYVSLGPKASPSGWLTPNLISLIHLIILTCPCRMVHLFLIFFSKDFIAFISSLNINCKLPLQESLTAMINKPDCWEELPSIYDAYVYFVNGRYVNEVRRVEFEHENDLERGETERATRRSMVKGRSHIRIRIPVKASDFFIVGLQMEARRWRRR